MINEYSANKYCCENISNIENYDKAIKDKKHTWCCHHRKEITENKSCEQLKKENLYFNVPAKDLIFLKRSEHQKLHTNNTSEETRIKRSKSLSGHIVSKEIRDKISKTNMGQSI